MSSLDAPSGSTTTALSSESSWKTSGAVSTQSPDPMQRDRSTSTRMRLFGESSSPTPARLVPPEARLLSRPRAAETDVDVVAVRLRLVEALLPLPAPCIAVGVSVHPLRARPPRAAVPDDLLHAHPPSQGVRVARLVRREQGEDELPGSAPVGTVVHVEVPVER